jgi:Inorganic pyrophosphatase
MGFGLLGIGGVFVILGVHAPLWAAGFGLGAATTAFIGCTGGGIYKTASETAAVLLGKSGGELSCEGPDNPAAITGYGSAHIDASGIARYHFTGYTGAVIAAIVLAFASKSIEPVFGYPFDLPAAAGSVYPLLISAAGIIAAATAVMFVRQNEKADSEMAIKTCKYVSIGIVVVFSMIVSWIFFGNFNCAISAVIGMIVVSAAGKTARTYAFGSAKHLKKITEQSQSGYMIISEYGTGMLSVLWPMAFLAVGVAAASAYAGFYGIALAAVGAYSSAGITVTADTYGSVTENADRIAALAEPPGETKTITNRLNFAGMAFKSGGKGFATAAAALALIGLFLSYFALTDLKAVNLMKPAVLVGLIIGAVIPVLLSAVVMNWAGKSAARIMDEVSRQLLAKAGGHSAAYQPDYVKCAAEGAKVSFKGIATPGLAALLVPLAGGMFLGTEVLGGLLAGMLVSGVLVSVIMNNTGGAWNHGGKQASADPLRDAAISFIMVFLEFVFLTAVVFAPVFLSVGSLV